MGSFSHNHRESNIFIKIKDSKRMELRKGVQYDFLKTNFSENKQSYSLSLLVPIYNEEKTIKKLYFRTTLILSSLTPSYEIIFIDDGSKDKSYKTLRDIQKKDKHVKIIKLINNFGQASAILAGFEFAQGEIIICMDGDLQNNPSDIPKLLAKIEEGFELVNGWRYERKDSLFRKTISKIENLLMYMKTGIKLHDYGSGFIVVKKKVTDNLKYYGDNVHFIKPLLTILAKSITEVKITHYPRKSGKSKYNLIKILKAGINFFFKFNIRRKESNKPIYIVEEIIRE